jgi:Cu/Zn superoxide dismutase
VELPRYSDYGQYDLALCKVEANKALPENQQQDIMGTITMWQKKTGGPLNFHVRLQGFDVGHGHHHDQQVVQAQDNEAPPAVGHRHGFHIHASGDLSNGCQSAGPHYNPKGVNHGSPHNLVRHVGDLGNIECDEHGNTNIMFSDDIASLTGQYSVIGRAIVIHAKEDDLGLGGDAESLRTGNAGARLACCVIQTVEKIPIRQYKAMKSATHYQNR